MNDERFLKDWLQDTTDPSSDLAAAAADKVVARLAETPQRRRWLPWPPVRRRTNDEPTTNGRTRSMISPFSLTVAGSLAVALGAAFLLAEPLAPVGDVPAAEGDAPPAPPVEVSVTGFGGACDGGSFDESGIKVMQRGSACSPTLESDDARLSGHVISATNQDRYADESRLIVEARALSIENDEGAWRSRPIYWLEYPGAADTQSDVWVLDGEGAYEGLSAVLIQHGFYEFHGFIVDGGLPPIPENGMAP